MESRMAAADVSASMVLRRGWYALLGPSLAAHAPFFAIAIGYFLIFSLAGLWAPITTKNAFVFLVGILTFSVPMLILALAAYCLAELIAHERPAHPIPALWRKMRGLLGDPVRMSAGLPMVAALILFMYDFTLVKGNITAFGPFSWDATFDAWDRALHFGIRPWELLQPIFGYWPITFILNLNYNMWFVVMNVFWVHYAFFAHPGEARTRFFLSFFTIWIIGGGILAIVFASAGPCYFGRLGLGPDPYGPLMAYLNDANGVAPIWALQTQEMLWRLWSGGSTLGGISAMPSMHNATATLFVLAAWGAAPWLRNLLIAHGLMIFLGSVHLGWHYAVDAYPAVALAVVSWMAMGRVSRWWEGGAAAQAYRRLVAASAGAPEPAALAPIR